MANKLIFESAEILQDDGTTSVGIISQITVDGSEIAITPNSVMIEDNREIYESFTGRIVIRTLQTAFDGGGDILSNAHVVSAGSLTGKSEGYLKLNGKGDSPSLRSPLTYIQGHNDFSNGRREIVLVAQAEELNSSSAVTVS